MGPGLLNIFVSDLGSGTEAPSARFADDIQLSCSHTLEGRDVHPQGPGQAPEVGLCEPHEAQQDQGQHPALGSGQVQAQTQAGGRMDQEQPQEKDFGELVDEGLNTTLSCAQAVQTPPVSWLDPQQCGQQVKGGDSAPWLCSGEAPPALLHPPLGPPLKEDMDLLEQVQRGHKDAQRAGAPLLWGQAGRAGRVQHGEGSRDTFNHLPVPT